MSDEAPSFFGIDLGTTNSVISYIDRDGRPVVVRGDASTSEVLPSVVYFENADNIIVGSQAKNVARLFPDRVVTRVKRSMGKEAEWQFDGNTFTPESISAMILKQLAADAAIETGRPVRQVVITVPAYFGLLERDSTLNAGRIAGLDVIGIVPEPVAAAIQYDLAAGDAERTILVYDLGGGTFDTTVIRMAADAIEVICTDGDQQLGGLDWDERLINHLLDEFVRQASPSGDPGSDEAFMQDLAKDAEQLKIQLSRQESRTVAIRYAGASAQIEVTRAKFEEMTADLLDRTIELTGRTLEKLTAKTGVTDPVAHIDEVLLVGGSSRMPAVAARLTKEYGWTPKLYDPDLAVAKGAARFAMSRALWTWAEANAATGGGEPTEADRKAAASGLAKQFNLPEQVVADAVRKEISSVLPKAFGVKLVDPDHPQAMEDSDDACYIEHLVHADDRLPSGPHHFPAGTVVPNQQQIRIEVYEQGGTRESRDLSANKPIDGGSGMISGLPPLPAGSPVDIAMFVDADGTLKVTAVEPTSGKDLLIEVRVSVMSEQAVADATALVSRIAVRA
jgi:molecular chaperone DnaK (HSP70)